MQEMLKGFADAQAAQIKNILKPAQWWSTVRFTPQIRITSGLAAQIAKTLETYRSGLPDNLPLFKVEALSLDMGHWFPGLIEWPDLSQHIRDLTATWFTPELLDTLGRIGRIGRPDNWDDTVALESAMELVATGWPIVWVPRSQIVVELMNAEDDDARSAVIVSHTDEILDDCEAALRSIDNKELQCLCSLATEAAAAARQNLPGAAQAAATSVVDSAYIAHWKLKSRALQQTTVEELGGIPISMFLQGLCLAILGCVFATFYPDRGDPVPDAYNRHASVHTVSDVQYTESNAIRAIMTATLVICQIDHEIAQAEEEGVA
jgi:hypothetical protein